MPNPLNTPNQFPQNGHARSDLNRRNGHSSPLTLDSPATESSQWSDSLSDLNDDWSSFTEETLNTTPRVWIRGLFYLLTLFVAIVLPWAMMSKVDEVGSARGQLEPQGKTFKIDAPVAGKVAEINVKEGEPLKAGQVLLELDSELAQDELQQAQAKLEGQLNRLSQLELMRQQLRGVTIRAQQQQGKATAGSLLAQVEETRQKLNHSKTQGKILRERLASDLNEVERYRSLVDEGIIAEVQVVGKQRVVNGTREELTRANSEAKEAESQLQAQQKQYESTVRENELAVLETQRQVKELDSQIANSQGEINQTKKQISALQFQLQQREVRSPINGVLFQFPIERPGAVVQPGQMVAQIAPEKAPLVLRANMNSQETGFLKVGMPVKIKFDAYPFQDYGLVEGRLTWISPSSKATETAQGTVQTFELEVQLNQPYIQSGDKQIALTPGQTATAEVIVRQRRVIDFLLDPFKKLKTGGLEL